MGGGALAGCGAGVLVADGVGQGLGDGVGVGDWLGELDGPGVPAGAGGQLTAAALIVKAAGLTSRPVSSTNPARSQALAWRLTARGP